MSAPGARKLLVAFRLRLCTITAGDGCAAGGLWYYALWGESLFVVLVAAVYGVVSLQKISSSKAHMTCEAFERLDVGVSQDMSFEMLVSGERLSTVCAKDHVEGGIKRVILVEVDLICWSTRRWPADGW